MNKLPNELVMELTKRQYGIKPMNIASLARTSKRYRNVLAPLLRKLMNVRNMYVALPRTRTGSLVPLRKNDMKRLWRDPNTTLMVVAPANVSSINYGLRKNALRSLKNTRKTNVVRHEGGTTFFVPNGTSYTLRPNGNLVSHRGMRNRVLYKNVRHSNIFTA